MSVGAWVAFVIGMVLGAVMMYINSPELGKTDIEYDMERRQFVCKSCGGYPVAYSVVIADDDDGNFKRYAAVPANHCPECGRRIVYSDTEMLERALERIEGDR